MSKHTPGPWSYEGDALTGRMFQIAAPFGGEAGCYTHVATVNNLPHHLLISRNPKRAEANARLIAEAPAMLETLKVIEHWLADARVCCFPRDMLHSTIARAEGRS